MMLSPYFWIAMLLAFIGVYETGNYKGTKRCEDHYAAQQAVIQMNMINEAAKQAVIDHKIDLDYSDKKQQIRTVYVKVKEKANDDIAKNPDYSKCGLDDSGLQLYNSKANPKNTASATH